MPKLQPLDCYALANVWAGLVFRLSRFAKLIGMIVLGIGNAAVFVAGVCSIAGAMAENLDKIRLDEFDVGDVALLADWS